MRRFGKMALAALMVAGAGAALSTPAAARTDIGISFGFGYPGYANFGPCDYYNYYNAPPPWGLPPNYCDYDVYYEPVFWGGEWYRGPIYYRWVHGGRVFWLNGGWRHDEWRGQRPMRIEWRERGREHMRWNGGHHWDGGHNWGGYHGHHGH